MVKYEQVDGLGVTVAKQCVSVGLDPMRSAREQEPRRAGRQWASKDRIARIMPDASGVLRWRWFVE
jgi:hypothetical protein